MDKLCERTEGEKGGFSLKKCIFVILGFLCLGLGTVGIVFPILPTVPFYLATTFFFAKGSQRFNNWFVGTKLYKKHLEEFVKNRSMSMEKVILLLSGVAAMLFVSMVMIDKLVMYIVFSVLIAAKCGYFIFKIKITNVFEARLTSRIIALILAVAMIAGMYLLDNIIIYVSYSIFLIVYISYFPFARASKNETVCLQDIN